MEVSPLALAVIGLMLAAWSAAAAWFMIRAQKHMRRAKSLTKTLRRLQRMLDIAPAAPMLVRVDGRIEAPERLARWLGLDQMPGYLSELAGSEDDGDGARGLSELQVRQLAEMVRLTQKSGAPFRLAVTPPGSNRSLAMQGTLADPQVSPGGAALVWVFDFTESESELAKLRRAAAQAESDFAALVGLIEAAPVPMWFRDRGMKLQLVNQAYVDAVAAQDAAAVIADQIELLEEEDGDSPADRARMVYESGRADARTTTATIHGARRTLKVSDQPLGREGVTGYAIDIEEQQQVRREFRAFREAQRAMLDQLSIGVAQFDADEKLAFANTPFRRLFDLAEGAVRNRTSFERFLSDAREKGRTPEVRDFPEWRKDHVAWFDGSELREEAWPLAGGQHLRIVAQPLPDGGMVLIAEDRTESLSLSATRDTLLRTRTATLDSLFEALAIFAPDGSLQLWNRSFAGTWGLSSEFLDTHPNADALLDAIGKNLARSGEAPRIGAVVRAATLDRKEKQGQVALADGRTLRFAGVPLPDGNGLLTVLDITASQKAEQALRERAEALEEADAVKARFLANMSYEFRTPLTSIGGYAELLKSGVAGELSESAEEYLDAIITAAARLTEQVENVLDLSQSEAGLLPINKQEIELIGFLAEIVREREGAIVDAGLGLDLKGKRGTRIEADCKQLGRAIGNLLDNAIAGTAEGGQITIEVLKQDKASEWSASIAIADDGAGMSKQELDHVLDGGRSKSEGEGGKRSGLGLPLAQQLVSAHGGRLEISSEPGVGTTAIVHLP